MADCKITHGQNKGFWIAESFMQLTLHYILVEITKPQYIFSNKVTLIDDIKFKIDGYANGYLTLGWGHFIETTTEEQTMIQALQNVKITLQNKGAFISIQEQKTIQTEDHTLEYMLGKKPFPTAELIRVIDALIQMLQGTWDSTNYNMDLNWRLYE